MRRMVAARRFAVCVHNFAIGMNVNRCESNHTYSQRNFAERAAFSPESLSAAIKSELFLFS